MLMLFTFEEFIQNLTLFTRGIFIFDKDGTITEPNEALDSDGVIFLTKLLETKKCIILTARNIETLETQILEKLWGNTNFQNLIFACSNGSEIYEYSDKKKYEKVSSLEGNISIYRKDIEKWVTYINEQEHLYITIEDRSDTMISLVCIPRESSKEARNNFDPDKQKRIHYGNILKQYFPLWEIIPGGSTTIDITLCTKYDGLQHLYQNYEFWSDKAIYFWDNFWEYGNDTPVMTDPIPCINIKSPKELFTFQDYAN